MTSSSSSKRPQPSKTHPPTLTIPPLQQPHTKTLLLLHGRGSNAETFSEPLLSTKLPSGLTFRQTLPHTRFVFPTSLFRRATFANRAVITQWFDTYSLDDLERRPDAEVAGLSESVAYVRELVGEEVEFVGKGNVVLGGLSLGACVAVVTALTIGGEGVGAVFGMAGRLPLRVLLETAMDGLESGEQVGTGVVFEDDESSTAGEDQSNVTPGLMAVRLLREELDLAVVDELDTSVPQIPFFLGHGAQDGKVPIRLGRKTVECLQKIGCNVTWREYVELGHWYHGQELEDIVNCLEEKCKGVHVSRSPHS